MFENQRSYYAIIPANVRYDNSLNANAKLLYGEITALCNEKGYCWATNEYFASLYGVSEKTITRWVSELKEKNYILTKVDTFRYNDGTVKKIRYIYIDKNVFNQMDKLSNNHIDKNVQDHTDKNVPYNNTLNNNTLNNNTNIYSLANQKNNIPYDEICEYLNKRINASYKASTKKTRDLITARFNEGFTLDNFKEVIDKKVLDWLNDKTMKKYLRPETLFGTKFESYLNQPMKAITTRDIAANVDIEDFFN